MKQLQNNFTAPKQSKRLLEMGIPADSADMYYHLANHQYYVRDEFSIKQHDFFEFYKNIFYPCWSVGRLIEIYGILRGVTCIFSLETTDIIDNIIACFDRNKLDFLKLEE